MQVRFALDDKRLELKKGQEGLFSLRLFFVVMVWGVE